MKQKRNAVAKKLALIKLSSGNPKTEKKLEEEINKGNQEVLPIFLQKQNDMLEEVDMFVIKAMATIAKDYPDIDITKFEGIIIDSLAEKIEEGKITTVESMDDKGVQNSIVADVVKAYDYHAFVNNNSAQEVVTNIAVGMTFAEFINKDMTQDEIKQFEKQYRASDEYKQALTSDMDKLFGANTQEEKENAAEHVRLRDLSIKSSELADRYEKHQGNKMYNVASIAFISRMAITNDPELMKEAIILAKKTGLDSLVKPDGTIDIDLAYETMLEQVKHDPKVAERYSTKEKFLEYLESKNKRDARVMARNMDENTGLKDKYQTAKTQEEKMEVLKSEGQKRIDRKEIMTGLKNAIHTKNNEELQTRMAELVENNPEWAKEILLRFASGDKTSQNVQAEIISFVNERYAAKGKIDIEVDTLQESKKPDLDDGER